MVHGAIIETLLPDCAGTNGRIPVLAGAGAPAIGRAFTFALSRARPTSPGVLAIGSVHLPGGGCTPQVLPLVTIGLTTSASGTASVQLPIPTTWRCAEPS
jgi:hypothetical protein